MLCADRNEDLAKYRRWLVESERIAQENYDKAVLALSGGALGVSFAFVREVVGPGQVKASNLLFWAWASWGTSATAVLFSYYFSHLALRKAIAQTDSEIVHLVRPGGLPDWVTAVLNAAAGLLFLLGVLVMIWFVYLNQGAVP